MNQNRPDAESGYAGIRIPSLFEIFFGKLANWFRRLAQWRKQGLLKRALQAARRHRALQLETLEPRLLLSADATYGFTPGDAVHFNDLDSLQNNHYILDIVDNAGTHEFRLRAEDGTALAFDVPGSAELATDGTNTITITGSDVLGDQLTIDLSGINNADLYDIEIIFNGGGYLLGGDLLGQQDKATISGDGTYHVDSFALAVNAPGSFLLDTDDIAIVQSDAIIEVAGTVNASSISLTANNTISLDASGFGLSSLKVTAIEAFADTRITVGSGGELLAGAGGVTLSATANITTVSTAESESGGDASVDAAIADTTIVSDVIVEVIGTGNVAGAGGAVSLTASHTVNAQTTADGTAGGASNGAVLGVGMLFGTTEASIEGAATVSGSSITLAATSSTTLTTLAKAAPGGAEDDDDGATSSETQGRLANPDDDAGTDDAAGTGEDDLSIAAALAITHADTDTRAFIASTGAIRATGNLNLTATSTTVASATADGSTATGGANSVGIAVAINVGDVESKASIAGGANIDAAQVNVRSLVPDTSTFTAEAKSGASDSDEVGVAGGLAINVVFVDSTATIEGGSVAVNALANSAADVTLEARSFTHSTAKANAAQDGGDEAVGVGASVAINISENNTRAAMENSAQLVGAHDLDMIAKGDHEMTTEAKGGASGGTAITPVAGITYANHQTEVLIGTGGTLTLTGALDAQADHTGKVATTAEGETQGSDVAVGASLALTITSDTVLATANRSITTGSAATLQAHGSSSSKADAKAAAKGAEEDDGSNPDGVDDQAGSQREGVNTQSQARGGSDSGSDTPSASTSEGPVSVAAAIAINIADATSRASVADGVTINADGAFKLSAGANADASAIADGSATDAGDVGIGAAVAINKSDVVNQASLGNPDADGATTTVNADGVTVEAVMTNVAAESTDRHTTEAKAKSGAAGGDVGVAGSLALNMVNLSTAATIDGDADVNLQDGGDGGTAVGASSIKAQSNANNTSLAEAEQEGGGDVGIGASVALSIVDADTKATIKQGAAFDGTGASGGNVTIQAISHNDVDTTAKGGSAGGVAITPVVSIAIVHNTAQAVIESGTPLTVVGALTVSASHEGAIVTKGEGEAEAEDAAIGASLALTYVEDTVEAKTLRNVTAGGAISFTAHSTASSRSEAVASAKGAAGEDEGGGESEDETAQGQIDSQRGFGNQRASQNGSGGSGSGGEAKASTTDDPSTTEEDEGAVSVAAAIGVNIAKSTVRASVADGLTLNAGGTLTIGTGANIDAAGKANGSAVDPENSDVGIGAAVAINYVETINEARLGDATVTATGVTVDAAMLDREVSINTASIPVVDTAENTIFLGLDHGLTTGQKVKYDDNGGTAIGGLNESDDYYVRVLEGGKVRLYTSEDAAKAGGNDTTVDDDDDDVVDLTSAGSGTGHKLKLTGLEGLIGEPVTFDTGNHRVLDLDEGHGLHTGDKVTYHDGAGGTIGGLGDGNDYYVIMLDDSHAELAGSRADALAGKALPLNSNEVGNDDTVTERTHGYSAQATSGAGGGDVGIAGSVAVNIVNVDTDAVIADGATVTVSGAATKIAAEAVTHSTSKALPVDDGASGGVGIGASVAVNVVDVNTHATVQDTAALTGSASSLDVIATGDHLLTTDAQNGATAEDVGIAVAAAIAISENETSARYGSASDLTVTGTANVKATHSTILETKAGSKAKGADAAIGASVGVNYVDEDVSATVAGDIRGAVGATNVISSAQVRSTIYAEATAGGNSEESNDADAEADNQTNNNSNTGGGRDLSEGSAQGGTDQASSSSEAESDTGSGGVGVAAAVAVNVMFVDNTAQVINGGDIDRSGAVAIRAESEVDASSKAVGLAVDIESSSSMIGAAVGVSYANVHNTASVGGGSLVKGSNVTVEAVTTGSERNQFVVWGAAAAGGGGDVSVAGSVGVNIVEYDTLATVSGDLRATGNLAVGAENDLALQTIAAGAGFSTEGSAIGAAVAVAIADIETTAILAGQADAANALTVSSETDLAKMAFDIPMLDDDPEVTTVAVSGAAAAGDAAIAGSAAVNVFDLTTDAHIAAGAMINQRPGVVVPAAQSVAVTADSHTDMANIAGSLAVTSGSAGVGAGLDLGIIGKDTRAYIGAGAQVDSNGTVTVDADSSEDLLSIAANAGVGSDAGIAVTASVYVMNTDTRAYLEDSEPLATPATVDADGAVSISATGDFSLTQIAGAIGAASTAGVGAAAAILVHNDTVEAYAGDRSSITAGSLLVSADSSEDIIAISAAGGIAGTAAISGAATVLVLNENTNAYVGRSAFVDSDGDVGVSSEDETFIISVAGSLSASGTAAVGVGADVGVINKTTQAYIDSGVSMDAEGDIEVGASSLEDITSVAAGLSASAGVSIALDASVHVLNVKTRAFIGDDPTQAPLPLLTGSVHADGNVILAADSATEIDKVVGVLAVGLVGGGAAGGITVIDKTTEGFIGNGANVSADGDTAGTTVATGQFTPGLVAGATFDPNAPDGEGIEASSASASTSSASYRSEGEIKVPNLGAMDADQDGGDDVGGDSFTKQRTLTPGQKNEFHGVAVTATNKDDVETFTMSAAGGAVGVAISAGVNVVNADTTAYIGDATVAADAGADVHVAAGSDFHHLAVAGTLAVGVVGVAPAVGVTVVGNTTQSYIDTGATVTAGNDVVVEAHGSEDVMLIGFGIAGGLVGIGGAVDVLSIGTTTKAWIGNADVSAGSDVVVYATDDTEVNMISGALAGGFVGIGASVGVVVIDKSTEAFIADGAVVDADGTGAGIDGVLSGTMVGDGDGFGTTTGHGVMVQAQSSEDVFHLVAAGGAGFVGVSGAVTVTVIDSDTKAYIGNADINQTGGNAGANAAQSVFVNASNEVRVTSFAGAVAGGFVGLGGAVDVGSIRNDTSAEILSGALVTAKNDVRVNSLGITDLNGFTFSGAGGVVGLTAAVSVWSIGTPIEKNYSDNDNSTPDSNALEGENGSADGDAVGQAGSSKGEISSQLSATGSADDGDNRKSMSERIGSGTGSASSGVNTAPGSTQLQNTINDTAPTNGVVASIANGAAVDADDDIDVIAKQDVEQDVIVGGFAGGLVGVGASIAVANIAANTRASAGGTLSAGGAITVKSELDEDVNITALGGSVGFVGLGAAVVSITDKSVTEAGISNNANITDASLVAISATGNQSFHGLTGQISAGAVGAGASFVKISVDNTSATDTRAFIGSNVDIGVGAGTVGSVSVTASSTIDAYAETYAISAGIGAMSGNFAAVSVTPEVDASVGAGSNIEVSGALAASATATPSARAETFGVAVGLGLGAGASIATTVASPVVTASVAGTVNAGSLSILARQLVPGGGFTAYAKTTGSSGGLVGIDATVSNASNNGVVRSFVVDGATLTINGSTNVTATNNTKQKADANSNAVGLIAAGISRSDASSNTTTEAYLGTNVKLAGRSLTITANGTDDNFADTVAGSAGLVAGASASADTNTISNTTAEIRNRTQASRDVVLTSGGTGALKITAEHTAKFNGRVQALAGGLFAGLGADVENDVTANVTAAVGANAIVTAKDVEIKAVNHINKQMLSSPNIDGTTGGFISGGGADSDTLLNLTTLVNIGNSAAITVVGSVATPGDLVLATLNDIVAKDKVAFTAGGALAGLGAFTTIKTNTDISRVQIGANASLQNTVGEVNISARGQGNVQALVEAEAYGIGTYTAAHAIADIRPLNEITIGTGAHIWAKRDLNLSTATDVDFHRDQYTMEARSDTFAGSAIPLSDVNSTTILVTTNNITIAGGALLETAGTARLHADRMGFADLSGSAKAVSWVSEVQDWLNGAAAAAMNDATIHQEAHATVENNGTVRTGIERHKELVLTGWNNLTGQITTYTQTGGVTFTSGPEAVESDLIEELAYAQKQLNLYGATNETLRQFYESEIVRITALLAADSQIDPVSGQPTLQYAITVKIDPLIAEAGRIDVRTDQLKGNGTFDAPGDASVNIQNHTPAFIKINGIVIPESNGGVFLNGSPVTTNTQINTSNAANALEENANNVPGEALVIPGVANFTPLPDNADAAPWIMVNNDYIAGPDPFDPSIRYPWPDITVLGDIRNLGGNVTLKTHLAGEGDINIKAQVFAQSLTILAGGTVSIDLSDIPNSVYPVGGVPYAIWGDITQGTVPGDDSGALYEGLAAADPDDVTDLLNQIPTDVSLYGDKIFIEAEFIDINGIIQSGKDVYNITLGQEVIDAIDDVGPGDGILVPLASASTNDYIVRYNTLTGDIELDELKNSGGHVELTGHILNSGNGIIRVLGGYATYNIDNNTSYDLVINRIDDSQPGDGKLLIKDKALGTPSNPYVTLYQQLAAGGAVQRTQDDGLGGDPTVVTPDVGTTSTYTPDDGWRFGWSVGVETKDYFYKHEHVKAWLGIDWLAADPATIAWDTHEVLAAPQVLEDGPYYYKDAAVTDAYTFSYPGAEELEGQFYTIDQSSETSWYGTTTYHREFAYESRNLHLYTHTIEADRPITVEFIGADKGAIDIESVGDVIIKGPILNPTGTVRIETEGAIIQLGDEARVQARRIELDAESGIGSSAAPINTDVSVGAGASLQAVTDAGEIHINEIFGDLPIHEVVSEHNIFGSGGKVSLTSQGGIVVGQDSVGNWYEGLVEGGAITLDAGAGIGSSAHSIVLDTGVFQWDKLNVEASGDVYLQEKSGNLSIESITSTGDVHINVLAGGIVDGNEVEQRDERTYEELKGGVWHDLQLTDTTGGADKVQEAKDSLAAIKEQEYRTYWEYRSTQPDGGLVYDPLFEVSLSASEEDFYRNNLGYDDAAIATLETSRTLQYHALHTQFGGFGDTYDADFEYTLTVTEIATIEARIHIFTEQELLYAISAGLLKDITDTQVTIEDPNIVAPNIVLTTSAGVGKASGQLTIDVSGGVYALSDDDRVALAAAERTDVAYLAAPVSATASFNAVGDTITRTDGGNWVTDGFTAGMRIHVAGSAVNSTGLGEFYLIESVSASVLNLTDAANLVTQGAVAITVTPEINNPTAEGVDIHSIVIDQREDVDIEINSTSGQVDVQAHDSVYLGSETHDLRLGTVQTDLTDEIRLKSGQGIVNALDASGTNVIGGNTILEAANGSIGTALLPVYSNLGASATITGRALSDIHLVERSGNMNVETMFSETGGVYLTTLNGSIVDALDTDFTKVAANHVELTANNGTIGQSGDYLEIDVAGTGTVVADADGSIWLAETFGNMNVEHVQSNTGDVDLKAFVSILDAEGTGAAEIIGNNITLTAEIGGIGLSGNDVDINSAYSGAGQLTSTSLLANAYIIEAGDGVLGATHDLTINEVSAGLAYAFITAPVGSILNGKVTGSNVISGYTYLIARNNIGASDKPLNTEVGNLEGKSILGSTWIVNSGDLEAGGVVDSGDPGMVAGGSIEVTASSPITVTENIVAAGPIILTASDSAGAGDDITVVSGNRIETAVYDFDAKTWVRNDGTIILRAGDNVLLQEGAQLLTHGEIFVFGDYGNADADVGSTMEFFGGISAASIEIHGGIENDSVLYSPEALAGHTRIFGGMGDDLLVVDHLITLQTSRDRAGDGTGALVRDTVDLDGQSGSDSHVVFTNGSAATDPHDYIINVFDTGAKDDGYDTLTVEGTADDDIFLLRQVEALTQGVSAPVTEDSPAFVALLHGTLDQVRNLATQRQDVERINYNENINSRLIVRGFEGEDYFAVDDNSAITTLDGGAGDDRFQVGQIYGSPRISLPEDGHAASVADGDAFATIETTAGFLSRGATFALTGLGGTGDDKFTVYSNKAELRLEGNDGNDEFVIRAFALVGSEGYSSEGETEALGGEGVDTILYNINAPVDLDGGAGFDKVVVIGTEFADSFVITDEGVFGAGLNVTYDNVEAVEVDGMEGDDHFYIQSTNHKVVTTVIGGLGSDTFDVAGDVPDHSIVSLDLEGRSGIINHDVSADPATDPFYDGLLAPGIALNIADASRGQVVIEQGDGSTIVNEQGETVDTYTVKLATAPEAGKPVYINVSASRTTQEEEDGVPAGDSVLMSSDGTTFGRYLVLAFDETNWNDAQTVSVKAVDDGRNEGTRVYAISHSAQSEDADFNHAQIKNVKVTVFDNDKPEVIVQGTGDSDLVLEGDATTQITDTYTVQLGKPITSGTVTVTLDFDAGEVMLSSADTRFDALTGTIVFDSTNWDDAVTLTITALSGDGREDTMISTIGHSAVASDAGYGTISSAQFAVTIVDGDAPGVYVDQTNGSTLVVQDNPDTPEDESDTDTYSVRLTQAPIGTVTIGVLTDGQTIAGPTPLIFDATNWWIPQIVAVAADSTFVPDPEAQPLKEFPIEPHVTNRIAGPLFIEGFIGDGADRSLTRAVILPNEIDPDLPVIGVEDDELENIDTLNIRNDSSVADLTGEMNGVEYGPDDHRINISGLGMSGDLTFDLDTPDSADDLTFAGGITFRDVEVTEVLLGQGNDDLTVNATLTTSAAHGGLTVVHGGGNTSLGGGTMGGDTITINRIATGDDSALVVFGDTGQDGLRYSGESGEKSVHGIAFDFAGNDVIDASGSNATLTIYGGGGDDTIWGSQAGDHIAGGSGDDTIHGQDGVDHVYGDSGINIDVNTRVLSVPTSNTAAAPNSFDDLATGDDTIHGDGGDDLVFGDHGEIEQTAGTLRILTTANVVRVETVERSLGGDDRIYGNDGEDVLMGGPGSDAIDGGAGKDLIFGDNVRLDRAAAGAADTNPRFRTLSGTQIYDNAPSTAAGGVLVTGSEQLDPTGTAVWEDFAIDLLDHDASVQSDPQGRFGDDYLAGGADNDQIFGQLGDDVIQGDGSIDLTVTAGRDAAGQLVVSASVEAASDGDDYIEGNGGADVVFGNLGQDDIIGGSSSLFSLSTPSRRPDGADLIFGGAGTDISRDNTGDLASTGHARDADTILGDNGNIYRLVGVNGTAGSGFLAFSYDDYDPSLKIIPRAAELLDYTPGGPDFNPAGAASDIGAADEIHGESGDDAIYGQMGGDVLFGEGQDDQLIGGWGNDWISGGTGEDGILGDDGRLYVSRNSSAHGESLYGIALIPVAELNKFITTPNGSQQAIINVDGALKYTADLTPVDLDPSTVPSTVDSPLYANDIIYGGWGGDSIHGGAGDDAISGAEAMAQSWATHYDASGNIIGTPARSDYSRPYNPGNVLGYNPATTKLALYDALDARREILLTGDGTLSKSGSGLEWLLNFTDDGAPLDTKWIVGTSYAAKPTDGDDVIFGDLGNDWIVGGTGRDKLWGGWGHDVLNADDVLKTNGGLNNSTDTNPSWEDMAYGGADRDVMIGNTNGDRLIDWTGEYNTFITPFSQFGVASVSRLLQPSLPEYLLALAESNGADMTLAAQYGTDAARNGEPYGELGMVLQHDAEWQAQNGGPRDPQGGNLPGGKVDVRVSAGVQPLAMLAGGGQASTTDYHPSQLTSADLMPIVSEAVHYWESTLGANDPLLSTLGTVTFSISDLPGSELGLYFGADILIDIDAAGHGWLLGGGFAGGMDPLTVVTHEIGHYLGFEHNDDREHGVMDSHLEGLSYVLAQNGFNLDPDKPIGDDVLKQLAVRLSEWENRQSAPSFDLGAKPSEGGAQGDVDWSGGDSSWSSSYSPYGKAGKAKSNFADFLVKLTGGSDRSANGSQGAYDSLGKSLLGFKGGTKGGGPRG